LRLLVLVVPLAGCSLLGWDDLTEGAGGAGTSSASASGGGGSATTSTGSPACVSDDASTAMTLSLDDGVHCYRRVHAGRQWGLAALDCERNYGGHLLTIEHLDEFALHAELYPDDCAEESWACNEDPMAPSEPRCDPRAWTAGRFEGGEPVWTTGAPWTWAEDMVFALGEPNDRIDPIALRREQLLDERPGNCPHPYICEIDP
jgi:hypothetical protein